jgi:thiol-disulfide isomerase/thioredoxin
MSKGSAARIAASALLGVGALALVMAGFIATQDHQDIRPMLVVAYVGFFIAGLLSPGGGAPLNWAGGVAAALGGILPALALSYFHVALTDHIFLAVYVAVAVAAVSMAIGARRLGSGGRRGPAIALSSLALLAAAGAAYGLAPAMVEQFAYADANRAVAPFAVRTLDGATVSSETWRGRVAVISYWATWCTPCLAEMPEVAAVQRKYEADPRVVILAVNAGYGGETAEKARAFLQRRPLEGAVAIDDIKAAGDKRGEGGRSLGLKVVPTLFILDRAGRLTAVHTGYDGAEHLAKTLSARIDRLLAKG